MDFDNLFILIIIFSFIARVIGDALKKGKKGPDEQEGTPPQRRVPQQRLPRAQPGRRPIEGGMQQRELPRIETRTSQAPDRRPIDGGMQQRELPRVEARTTQAPPDRAEDMIPAELWEILTGQRRPPIPVPAPRPVPDEADDDEELVADEESLIAREISTEDRDVGELVRRRREIAARRERDIETYRPTVVSLETDPLPTAARHAAFHKKFEAQAPAKVLNRGPKRGLGRIAGEDPGALRRAIILHEVLGRPKGLE